MAVGVHGEDIGDAIKDADDLARVEIAADEYATLVGMSENFDAIDVRPTHVRPLSGKAGASRRE